MRVSVGCGVCALILVWHVSIRVVAAAVDSAAPVDDTLLLPLPFGYTRVYVPFVAAAAANPDPTALEASVTAALAVACGGALSQFSVAGVTLPAGADSASAASAAAGAGFVLIASGASAGGGGRGVANCAVHLLSNSQSAQPFTPIAFDAAIAAATATTLQLAGGAESLPPVAVAAAAATVAGKPNESGGGGGASNSVRARFARKPSRL